MIKLECIRDCDAMCCKVQQNHRVVFDLSDQEVEMFRARGAELVAQEEGGYTMTEDCVFLRGKLCVLHGKKSQPRCCADNKVGESLCLSVRESVIGKRWNEVE